MSDRETRRLRRLVLRASQGDARAFGRLYGFYVDRVYAFVRARVWSNEDAEDLTETVFLSAYKAIGRYDERGLPFSAWLFRIARNATIDWHRKNGRQPVRVDDADAEALPGPVDLEEVVFARVYADRVREAIRKLTEEQAAVIMLRFYWGASHQEAAAALGKTEGAAKALQHRAVRRLADLLKEENEDD